MFLKHIGGDKNGNIMNFLQRLSLTSDKLINLLLINFMF